MEERGCAWIINRMVFRPALSAVALVVASTSPSHHPAAVAAASAAAKATAIAVSRALSSSSSSFSSSSSSSSFSSSLPAAVGVGAKGKVVCHCCRLITEAPLAFLGSCGSRGKKCARIRYFRGMSLSPLLTKRPRDTSFSTRRTMTTTTTTAAAMRTLANDGGGGGEEGLGLPRAIFSRRHPPPPPSFHRRPPLVIVLAGPTGVGKSAVAASLCRPDRASRLLSPAPPLSYSLCGKRDAGCDMELNGGGACERGDIVDGGDVNNDENTHDDDDDNDDSESMRINNLHANNDYAYVGVGHIISADSVQAYQGVEIGANKPTNDELTTTPHHLINVVDPATDASYNAAEWTEDAMFVLDVLTGRKGRHWEQRNEQEEEETEAKEEGKREENETRNEQKEWDDANETSMSLEGKRRRRRRITEYLEQSLSSTHGSCKKQLGGEGGGDIIGESSSRPTADATVETTIRFDRPAVLPVVTGGTMMYLQWLVHGRPDVPKPSEKALLKAAAIVNKFRAEEEEKKEEEEKMGRIKEKEKETEYTMKDVERNKNDNDADERKQLSLSSSSSSSSSWPLSFTPSPPSGWDAAASYASSLGAPFQSRVEKLCGRKDWYRLRRILEVAFTVLDDGYNVHGGGDGSGNGNDDDDKRTRRKRNANSKMAAMTTTSTSATESATSTAGRDESIERDLVVSEKLIQDLYTGRRSGGIGSFRHNYNNDNDDDDDETDDGGYGRRTYDVRCFFLCPTDRLRHASAIDDRCEDMLLRGLLRETTNLRLSGQLPDAGQPSRSIGYRQALSYLCRSDARSADAKALDEFVSDFASATRRYSKKQMQWFRNDSHFAFVPMSMSDDCGRTLGERVEDAADIVVNMCLLPREEYEREIADVNVSLSAVDAGAGADAVADASSVEKKGKKHYNTANKKEWLSHQDSNLTLSQRTKLANERQGKSMKLFVAKRHELILGSEEFASVLKEADECTARIQGLDVLPPLCVNDRNV